MPSPRDIAIASAGWLCLVAFGVDWLAGGGKTVLDYAVRSLQPLPPSRVIAYDDDTHALWSGWWTPAKGYRLTNDTDPKIIFLAERARDCGIELTAVPLEEATAHPQPIYVALNGRTPVGPAVLSQDRNAVIAHIGDLADGANVLAFRLPEARKMNLRDERALAIGVRSVALACRPD